MNWEQKLAKLQELKPNLLHMGSPGVWYCEIPGEIGGDGLLSSEFANGTKPSEAVNAAYDIVVGLPNNRYLVTTGLQTPRQCYLMYNGEWVRVVGRKEAC